MRRWRHAAVRIVSRLASEKAGAAAVEFALVALPFIMLLGVVTETGLVTLSQQTLDLSVERAARQLRTGTFQEAADGSDPTARLQRVLCGGAFVLFSCADIRIEVVSVGAPSLPVPSDPYEKTTKGWATTFGTRFDCPKGDDIVVVRAAAPVPRMLWFLDFTGRVLPDGRQLLVATRVFQSEAYDQKSCV